MTVIGYRVTSYLLSAQFADSLIEMAVWLCETRDLLLFTNVCCFGCDIYVQ